MTMTFALALYGAVLSSASAVWNIRRDVRDRGRLRVRARVAVDNFFPSTPGIADHITFELVNDGRRALIVQRLGGIARDGKPFELPIDPTASRLRPTDGPLKLEPGERLVVEVAPLRQAVDGLRRLCAWDTLGRRYCAPASELRAVQRAHFQRAKKPARITARTGLRGILPPWTRI